MGTCVPQYVGLNKCTADCSLVFCVIDILVKTIYFLRFCRLAENYCLFGYGMLTRCVWTVARVVASGVFVLWRVAYLVVSWPGVVILACAFERNSSTSRLFWKRTQSDYVEL